MKLTDLIEMTQRGGNLEGMPFPEFPSDAKFEGKMEGGLEVYSFKHAGTIIFGVKMKDEFVSFNQVSETTLPHVGKVLLSQNMKTKIEFRGQKLSLKLMKFITVHLGLNLLLGDVHSIDTVKLLKSGKLDDKFEMKLVNVKTGELVDWSVAEYEARTRVDKKTEWSVLLLGSKNPFYESNCNHLGYLGKEHENRHMWTYLSQFDDIESDI